MSNTPDTAVPDSLDGSLRRFLDALLDPKHQSLIAMLAEDAVMEFPYALPTSHKRLEGKNAIVGFLAQFEDFLILREITSVTTHRTTNPHIAILEYEGAGESLQTSRAYRQKYITVLTFRDGLICHWKDYWNPVSVLAATGDLDQPIRKVVMDLTK